MRESKSKGLVLVFTGNGKGKTTAALGTALRAIGHGWRVMVIQFIKAQRNTGEMKAAELLAPQLTIHPMGVGLTWEHPDEENRAAAREAWRSTQEVLAAGEYELVILDEINVAVAHGYVTADEVLAALEARPRHVHVILTGRHAPPAFVAAADLVSDVQVVKHPLQSGRRATKGIDF